MLSLVVKKLNLMPASWGVNPLSTSHTFEHLSSIYFFSFSSIFSIVNELQFGIIEGLEFIGSYPAAAGSSVEEIHVLGLCDKRAIDKIYTSCLNSSHQNCC